MTAYTLAKAKSHAVERGAAAAGLILTGLVVGTAGALLRAPLLISGIASLVVTVAVLFCPADRLSYSLTATALTAGKLTLPIQEMQEVRLVTLDGSLIYRGLVLPGYWVGKAWSRRLGRFFLVGSTGLGQGVMIVLKDGSRVVVTPDKPENLVVTLLVMRRGSRVRLLPSH